MTVRGGRHESPAPGAYGLRLPDLAAAAELLVAAPPHWQPWRIDYERESDPPADRPERFAPDGACLRVGGGGWIDIDRQAARSTLRLPQRPDARAVVHPFLSLTAAATARWSGWDAFHAGGVVIDGRVWGLLGDKGAGKSSTLAQLLRDGVPVMADDILVVRDGRVLAGPRCLDLREQTAQALELGEPIGMAGDRERWRLTMPPIDTELPLGGFVELTWADAVSVESVRPRERLALLASQFVLRMNPPSWERILGYTVLPMWRLGRPRVLGSLCEATERLRGLVSGG
jgi:hypothetical protein